MKKKIYFLFGILVLFSLNFIYADIGVGTSGDIGVDLNIPTPVNYTSVNVNNSIYWNGNAWSDTRWLEIDGSNANQDIDIGIYNFTTTGIIDANTYLVDSGYGLFAGEEGIDGILSLVTGSDLGGTGSISLTLDGDLDNMYFQDDAGDFQDDAGEVLFISTSDISTSTGEMSFDDDNIVTTGNVSASWFKGLFNWIVGDDWNSFNGSTLLFNESKLSSVYYNATTSQLVAGILDGGTLDNTRHSDASYDGVTMNFSEQAGSPGLDVRVNFTVESFNRVVFRYKTSELRGDYPLRQLWNYDNSEWENYHSIGASLSFSIVTQPVFDNAEHVQDGIIQMRLYKESLGNPNNHYYIDWVAMVKGVGTPSGVEVDPLSFHRNLNLNNSGYNITADYFFGDGSQLTGIGVSDIWVNVTGDTMTGSLNMSNNNITDINYLKLTNTTTTWNMYVDVNGTLVWEQE